MATDARKLLVHNAVHRQGRNTSSCGGLLEVQVIVQQYDRSKDQFTYSW